jgi:hypothetical protein
MLNKKSLPVLAIICLVIMSATVLTGCPASSTDKTTTTDTTSAMQDSSTMQAVPMDTTMKMDTSTMDTASTRPVRNPH